MNRSRMGSRGARSTAALVSVVLVAILFAGSLASHPGMEAADAANGTTPSMVELAESLSADAGLIDPGSGSPVESLADAQARVAALRTRVPQSSPTQDLDLRLDAAIGAPAAYFEFVYQFHAACGWWSRILSAPGDASVAAVVRTIPSWPAFGSERPLHEGDDIGTDTITPISAGLLAAKGSSARAEGLRLYTVNCVSPKGTPTS